MLDVRLVCGYIANACRFGCGLDVCSWGGGRVAGL